MSKTTKRFRVTLDFTITIDEDAIPPGADSDEHTYNERQHRLFLAVLNNEHVLNAYCRYLLSSWFENGTHHWDKSLLAEYQSNRPHGWIDLEQILPPAIAALSIDDQTYFQEVYEEGIFYENTETFQECFSEEMTSFTVVEDVK